MPYIGAGVQRFNTADNLTVTGTSELKNDVTVTGDVTASGTVLPTGDTAAGDAAALGFTSAEGLILTGQGSTNDITIKNDADADVLEIPTGTTNVTIAGNLGVGGTVTGTGTSVFASLDISGDIDVDGTTNLDAVDIDGNVDIATTATLTCGAITSSISDHTNLTLTSTNADANAGPKIVLNRDSGSPADGDATGEIIFKADDDGGNSTEFAKIESSIIDASNTTEDGRLIMRTMTAGTATSRLDFTNTETVFNDSSIDVDFRVESDGNANMIFVDAENDFVGIGEGSPNVTLHVTGPSGQIAIDTTSGGEPLLRFRENGSTRALLKMDGTNNMQFHTGPDGSTAEVARFNQAGALLIGKTSDSISNNGISAAGSATGGGFFSVTNAGNPCATFNRKSSTGDIVTLNDDGTLVGQLGTLATSMYLGSHDTGLSFEGNQDDSIYPASPSAGGLVRDNLIDLGYASGRFDDIFATNSTINTSDENEKQDIASLTSAEVTAAKAISKLFKTFKWKDKVVAKGDAARTHTGVVAQQVQRAMSDAGLDATKYAFWCSNTWTNADGNEQTRMGVRYPELLAFVGAATEQRLADIETRLAALESQESKLTQNIITIDGKEYKPEDMDEKQTYLISQIRSCQNKAANIRFELDQVQAAQNVFINELIKSVQPEGVEAEVG